MQKEDIDRLQWGQLRDWVQLVRFPTAFTLLSNSLVAALLAAHSWRPLSGLLPTLAASLCAYWAGMILNDVVDLEDDKQERPTRPLAAGRISPTIAGHVGTALLMICPMIILGVTALHDSQPLWQGAAFGSAVLLVLCIRVYDSSLKKTPLGPFLMGACRGLNVLMVGCTMFSLTAGDLFPQPILFLAAGVFVYILGVTVFARGEERSSSDTVTLSTGLVLELAGLVIIALLPRWTPGPPQWTLDPQRGYPLLVGLIGLTVANRSIKALLHPVPRKVQLAVKHALLTLVLIDASVALMFAGPWYGCAIVVLLVPALAAALNFRTT